MNPVLIALPLADALERSLNAAARVDANLAQRITDLDGRGVRFIVTPTGSGGAADALYLDVGCHGGAVRIAANTRDSADDSSTHEASGHGTGAGDGVDAIVCGAPAALAELMVRGTGTDLRSHGAVQVSGDAAVIDDFRHCFKPQMPRLHAELGKLFDGPLSDSLIGTAELGAALARSGFEALFALPGATGAGASAGSVADRILHLARDQAQRISRQLAEWQRP